MESDPVRIKSAGGTDVTFRSRLEQAWEVGFVADITLVDGTECSAVLIAMSSTCADPGPLGSISSRPGGRPLHA